MKRSSLGSPVDPNPRRTSSKKNPPFIIRLNAGKSIINSPPNKAFGNRTSEIFSGIQLINQSLPPLKNTLKKKIHKYRYLFHGIGFDADNLKPLFCHKKIDQSLSAKIDCYEAEPESHVESTYKISVVTKKFT